MSKRDDIIRALDLLDEFRALAIELEIVPEGALRLYDDNYQAIVNMRKELHASLGSIEHELMGAKTHGEES